MKIGIDIDGVLTNIDTFIIETGSKYFYDKGIFVKNPNAYDLKDVFEVDDKEANKFWDEYLLEYFDCDIRYGAKEVIDILRESGASIYMVTSRGRQDRLLTKEEVQNITKNWLKKNGIEYKEIYFASPGEGKREICEKLELDIMIDDFEGNIYETSKVCKSIIFDASHNKKVKGKNIIRAYSWYDILHIIEEINKNI